MTSVSQEFHGPAVDFGQYLNKIVAFYFLLLTEIKTKTKSGVAAEKTAKIKPDIETETKLKQQKTI